jgi:GNAT superfamily N-acetyltransferase
MPIVRDAREPDAADVARVHVDAWEKAYRGLIADELISARAAERDEQWRSRLAAKREREHVVVAELDGRIVGFAAGGPSPDIDLDPAMTAEVKGLYVDPAFWRRGLGDALLSEVLQRLRRDGFGSATLWVLAQNEPARTLYESRGWKLDGTERHDHVHAGEVRYALDL